MKKRRIAENKSHPDRDTRMKVIALWADGRFSQADIARRLDVSRQRVSEIFAQEGLR